MINYHKHNHCSKDGHIQGRQEMTNWLNDLQLNPLTFSPDFLHSVGFHLGSDANKFIPRLHECAEQIPTLEALVSENDFRFNLPRLEKYDSIGRHIDHICFHPTYLDAGDIVYGTGMMEMMSRPGGLLKALSLFFLTSHAGEAGHNCPVACTAGVIRILSKVNDFEGKAYFWQKLLEPSFRKNFTGAQFLTEVQGGSDVGRNATRAIEKEDGSYSIEGEKWFCSNANAELILMTARYDSTLEGTRGLGLFLIPRNLPDGSRNSYTLRRLKEKLGTRTMASAEIDFNGAFGIHMGPIGDGFKLIMQNVLHISRIYNTFSVCGSGRRALQIATRYSRHRRAFGKEIGDYPLVQENLANIQAENMALLASAMRLAADQDKIDLKQNLEPDELLLQRLMANLNKYISALWSVQHIHHCIDVLAGNGAIESFSSLPRLLRDSIVCENWEGTHNTLRMQVLRDILRYNQDKIYSNCIRARLSKLSSNPFSIELQEHLKLTENLFTQLRKAETPLQSYLIKDVFDKMSVGHLALCLLEEGQHMSDHMQNNAKLLALEVFMNKHIRHTTPSDQAGLNKFATLIEKFNYAE